ncbi:MAG: hypothetical protein SFY32_03680 [Bacteroidota bacterium]|nr:hypothetical protein [Bacteroidota bacterium]
MLLKLGKEIFLKHILQLAFLVVIGYAIFQIKIVKMLEKKNITEIGFVGSKLDYVESDLSNSKKSK